MTYKIEVPVLNYVHNDARALSGYIDLLLKYKEHIDCLYLPLGHVKENVDVWGIRAPYYVYINGRVNKPGVIAWENALDEIIEYTGLPVKILMNDTYNPAFGDKNALSYIAAKLEFYSEKFSLKSIVIADYTLVPFLRDRQYPISLSTNSHNSFSELDMAFLVHGTDAFDSIVLQRDLNRNPKTLLKFINSRNLLDKTVLMVNEGCVLSCPFKESGDVEISTADVHNNGNVIHTLGCGMLQKKELVWLYLTSPFLTKNMIKTYYPTIKTIKLAGRSLGVSSIKHQLQHWVDGTEKQLTDLFNVFAQSGITTRDLEQHEHYVNDVMSCNKECSVCRRCEKVWNEVYKPKEEEFSIPWPVAVNT